jgi:hypothetical protein
VPAKSPIAHPCLVEYGQELASGRRMLGQSLADREQGVLGADHNTDSQNPSAMQDFGTRRPFQDGSGITQSVA